MAERYAYNVGIGDPSLANAYADLDGSSSLTTRRLYLDAVDALFARISDEGDLDWYLTDRLGSVRDIMDNAGVIQDHLDYGGFGVHSETDPAYGDRYKFTAREFDEFTGLQDNRARSYSFDIMGWMSEDPLRFAAGDPNLLRYVGNNPMNAIDPSGQVIWFLAVPAIAGAILIYPPEANPPHHRPPNPGRPVLGALIGTGMAYGLWLGWVRFIQFRIAFAQGQINALRAHQAQLIAAGRVQQAAAIEAEIQAILNRIIDLGLRVPAWLR